MTCLLKYNSPILLALSFLVGGLVMGLSLNAYAQTSDLIPLDQRNHYGQFSIDNVQVSEKDYYKVVSMDVHVKVKDLALEDISDVYWDSITLTNENGKKYQPEGNGGPDCKKEWDGTFWPNTTVTGSEGGIGQHSFCFMVEKEFTDFKVYYTIPFYNINNPNNPYPSFQIGNIDLTQNTNTQVQTPSSSPSDSNLSASSPSDSNLSASSPSDSSISPSTTNIFEQLTSFLKQIFHFMILGSSFLNDS